MALTDNLNCYWKFDESSGNASDSSGNGTTLTNNGTVTYASAKINNGAVFSSGKYFTAGDNAHVSRTGDTTWQVWWYPTSLSNSNPYGVTGMFPFFDKWSYSTSQREYEIFAHYSGGVTTLGANLSSNGTASTAASKTTTGISVNNWYHLVYVYTASTGTMEIFINGSSLGTSTGQVTSLHNGTAAFAIGRFLNDAAASIEGTLDEAAIWSRALSSAEVTSLYNGGAGLQYPFVDTPSYDPNSFQPGAKIYAPILY